MVIGLVGISGFACNSGDENNGSNQKTEDGWGKDAVKLTSINSIERAGINEVLSGGAVAEAKGAKNEVTSFQIVVSSLNKNIEVFQAECSDLKGEGGAVINKQNIQLFREAYVMIREPSQRGQLGPGLYTDPLVPLVNPYGESSNVISEDEDKPEVPGIPFTVWRGQNQPLWVDVSIPKSAATGEYKGEVTISFREAPYQWGGGTTEPLPPQSVTIPVSLNVWNFSLPDGPTHNNHFGGVGRISYFFNVDRNSAEFREIAMRYYRLMADNGINPPLPQSFLPEVKSDGHLNIMKERTELLKKFVEDLHVTNFPVPMPPMKRENIITTDRAKAINYFSDYYQYLKENGWDKIAYLYMFDEPNTKEAYDMVLELGKVAHEGAPQLKSLVVEQTYTQDPSWADIDPSVDIWCPLFSFIDRKTIDEKIAQGDEVWSYTALSQRSPRYDPLYDEVKNYDPPYWHIDDPLSAYRVPTWMNWQYNITGLLYWSTMTGGVDHPWELPAFRHSGYDFNGGGFLIYPGVPCGVNGPIASIRLKNIRDGLTDYKYFAILEKLAGKEAVTNFVSKIAPNWWDINYDSKSILSVREEIAEEIIRRSK